MVEKVEKGLANLYQAGMKLKASERRQGTMQKWKRQYHYAVRRAKGKSCHVRAERLFVASMEGDVYLVNEIKKFRFGSGTTRAELPDNVADKNGEEEIVDKF